MYKSAARLIDCLLAAALLLSLIAYAYLCSYSRYMADDFTALGPVQQHGLLAAQITWYRGWTGRFAFSFVYSIVALLGPTTPRFLPGLLLLLWFAGVLWASFEKGPSDLHLRTDPAFWINEAVATYYGLRSVRASEDVAISNLKEKESRR